MDQKGTSANPKSKKGTGKKKKSPKSKSNQYEKKNMDVDTKFKSVKYTEQVKKTSSIVTQVIMGFILAAIIGYTGYLIYDLSENIKALSQCNSKPSSTDVSFTCPDQKPGNVVYWKNSEGLQPAGLFYGAVNRPNF